VSGRDRLGRFEAAAAAMREDLAALVAHESPSDDGERVSALAAFVRDRLLERGVRAETRACPPRGDALLARVGEGERGTLLLGHHDTVWPVGTLAERPLRAEGDRIFGPGAFDMKAGIAVALAALDRPPAASLLLVPDEEVGTGASRELLLAVAREHARVLVLEPSQDGAVKLARKGVGTFHVAFEGRAAHAGLDPEKGASALAELSRCTLWLAGLGDAEAGSSVTPTVARAGSATNVVPASATLAVDVRVWTSAEAARIVNAIEAYRPADPRVSCRVEGGFDRPPLEPTPESEALFQAAERIAAELGRALGSARVGGASDGNITAAAGLPTLDGLGPAGGGAHASGEFVLLSDLQFRAALIAGLVLDLA
jgi:glutamate carboxypeptidase